MTNILPSTFTPLSYEQCREAMFRLQNYARWMYHSPAGVEAFSRNAIEYEGRKLAFSIEPDGRIAATIADNGAKIIYEVFTTTAPLQGDATLDNVNYVRRVANKDDLIPIDAIYAEKAGAIALSMFQRTQVFQFFCRAEPSTLDGIARDLSLAKEPSL